MMDMRFLYPVLVAMCSTAQAAQWKQVGFLEPVQLRIYVDKDSVVDREKFKTAVMKIEGEQAISHFAAYCDERESARAIVFEGDYGVPISKPFEWQKQGRSFSISTKTLTTLFDTVCRKPWEVWK